MDVQAEGRGSAGWGDAGRARLARVGSNATQAGRWSDAGRVGLARMGSNATQAGRREIQVRSVSSAGYGIAACTHAM